MGILYRARDTVLDREVALKTIAGTGSLDPELKERFYREARAGARLHHPNVITVYELGEQEELVFIALELLSGMDLRQFIAQRIELPAEKKIAIMAAVCDGLQHAHQNGITHRDIKPSNIFLTDSQVPKILDFGVARLSASKLTVVGRVLGTPFYMAPEQIMGQPCDARSDLFSLAIVTFEVLCFAHPFAGDSIPKRIINDSPDSILMRNPDLPPALDAVLFKALARDPAHRYQTVAEFGQALRGVIEESQPSPPPRTRIPAMTMPPTPPAAPTPTLPKYANTEHKMSAILMALQGFDEAIEKRNLALARTALETVETLAKIDDRFATAAKESRARLQELEATMPPEPEPAPPQPVAVPPTMPPRSMPPVQPRAPEPPAATPTVSYMAPEPPRTAEPPGARTTIPPTPPPARTIVPTAPPSTPPTTPPAASDDATSMFRLSDVPVMPPVAQPPRPTPAPPSTRLPTNPPAPPRTMGPRPPAPSAPPAAPRPTQPPAPSPAPSPAAKIDRKALIAGGGGLALILIVVIIWAATRGGKVAIVPAAGTAQVAAAQAPVYQTPSDSAPILVTLKKGDVVNVIRPPRSRSQEWTEVQYVAGKTPSAAGAMHTTDLTSWSSSKPDVALYFIEMYAPGPGAGDAELRQYAQNLSAFIQHFSGTPQQNDAKAELDKTNAALAHATAPGQGKNPATAAPKPPTPPFDAEGELQRAEKLWENGDYAAAERSLRRILQQKPDFSAARMLLDKVQKARKLEGGK
jgi:hypothetical protein